MRRTAGLPHIFHFQDSLAHTCTMLGCDTEDWMASSTASLMPCLSGSLSWHQVTCSHQMGRVIKQLSKGNGKEANCSCRRSCLKRFALWLFRPWGRPIPDSRATTAWHAHLDRCLNAVVGSGINRPKAATAQPAQDLDALQLANPASNSVVSRCGPPSAKQEDARRHCRCPPAQLVALCQ